MTHDEQRRELMNAARLYNDGAQAVSKQTAEYHNRMFAKAVVAQQATIDKLREALRPFAELYRLKRRHTDIEDLRRAASAQEE